MGTPHVITTKTTTAPVGVYNQTSNDEMFAAPKDPGSVTVSIEMIVNIYNPHNSNNQGPPATDTIHDTITLKVEAPTVKSYVIADSESATTNAAGLSFGFVTGTNAADAAPSATSAGGAVGFLMTDPNRTTRKSLGMWAQVVNTTHYDLTFGFIQKVASFDATTTYTNNHVTNIHAADALDDLPRFVSYFYQDVVKKVPKGTTAFVLNGNDEAPSDSPAYTPPMSNGSGWLVSLSYYAQFRTSLVVAGGNLASGGPAVGGYPIALSTATWHYAASATNVGNQNAPGDANLSSTSNMGLWTSNVGIGSGPLPNPVPGSNGPWTARGDGKRSYLEWTSELGPMVDPNGQSAGSIEAANAPAESKRFLALRPLSRFAARSRSRLLVPTLRPRFISSLLRRDAGFLSREDLR